MEKKVIGITAIAGVITYPIALLPLPTYYFSLFYTICSTVALAVSWDIMGGKTGYFSIGHAAYYGSGAYVCAMFANAYPAYALLGIPLGGLAASCLAPIIGAISLRLKALFFGIATLLFGFVLETIVLNVPATGRGEGIAFPPSASLALNVLYVTSLTIAFIAIIIHLLISGSRFGYGLTAIKDDEIAAEAIGVNSLSLKVRTFWISAFIAGLAGTLYPIFVSFITPDGAFSVALSLNALLAALLGGAGFVLGAIIGATFLVLLQNLLVFTIGGIVYLVIFGCLLSMVVMFLPAGIVGSLRRRFRR